MYSYIDYAGRRREITKLEAGIGTTPEEGLCIMQNISYMFSGELDTARSGVPQVLSVLAMIANDAGSDWFRNKVLIHYLPRLASTSYMCPEKRPLLFTTRAALASLLMAVPAMVVLVCYVAVALLAISTLAMFGTRGLCSHNVGLVMPYVAAPVSLLSFAVMNLFLLISGSRNIKIEVPVANNVVNTPKVDRPFYEDIREAA